MRCDEVLAPALANRVFLYRYAWRLFAVEPDEPLSEIAVDGQTMESCAVFAGLDSDMVRAQEYIAKTLSDSDCFRRLRAEYVRLFVGPTKLPAPPWESVYVCGEDVIFQESTLDVREAFRAAGYEAGGYPHEADDHIATELGFMAALSDDALRLCQSGDGLSVSVALSRQVSFLSEHLNMWLPQFGNRLASYADPKVDPYYLACVGFAVDLCRRDVAVIEELMSE